MKIFTSSLFLLLLLAVESFPSGDPNGGFFWISNPRGYTTPTNLIEKYFFNPSDSVVISWTTNNFTQPNVYFKFGTTHYNYNLSSINVGGNRVSFIPGNSPLNFTTGIYHGCITNSSKNTYAEIEADYAAHQIGRAHV